MSDRNHYISNTTNLSRTNATFSTYTFSDGDTHSLIINASDYKVTYDSEGGVAEYLGITQSHSFFMTLAQIQQLVDVLGNFLEQPNPTPEIDDIIRNIEESEANA